MIHQTGNRLGIDINTILQSLGSLGSTKPKSRDLKNAVNDYLNLRASAKEGLVEPLNEYVKSIWIKSNRIPRQYWRKPRKKVVS